MKNVFVSSTFRDMQAERDVIHYDVVPALNAFAREYGESVQLLDLRWGVNTADMDADSGARMVLNVCLDAIDRCQPYMIIMLGEKYGWVPPDELMEETVRDKDYRMQPGVHSVTELEIEYGSLSREQQAKCFFYFRDALPADKMSPESRAIYLAADEDEAARMRQLKDRITAQFGDRVRSYEALWDEANQRTVIPEGFTARVVEDISGFFAQEWGDRGQLTWQDRELLETSRIMEEKLLTFSGREDLLEEYGGYIDDAEVPLFILQGSDGIGKSSLLSRLARGRQEAGDTALFFTCGLSVQSRSTQQLLRYFVYHLEDALGKPHGPDTTIFQEWRGRLELLCQEFCEQKEGRLVFFVDALEELDWDETAERFSWVPLADPQRVAFVAGMDHGRLITAEVPIHDVPYLSPEESRAMIESHLRYRNKSLAPAVVDKMMRMVEIRRPFCIDILIQRLTMFNKNDFDVIREYGNDMDAINRYLLEVIDGLPTTVGSLSVEVIGAASSRIDDDFMERLLTLLAASRRGLRETDLEAIFRAWDWPWDALSFAWLRKYLSSFFIEDSSGRIDFGHGVVRTGLVTYLKSNLFLCQHILFEHMKTLPVDDPISMEETVHLTRVVDGRNDLIDYIRRVMKVGPYSQPLLYARRNIKDICHEDRAEWFCKVLNHAQESSQYTVGFGTFVESLRDSFDTTPSDNHVKLGLCETLLHIFQRSDEIWNNQTSRRDLQLAMQQMADTIAEGGSPHNRENAYFLYEGTLKELEKLEAPPIDRLAHTYERMGELTTDDALALGHFEKAVELRKEAAAKADYLMENYHLQRAYSFLAEAYFNNAKYGEAVAAAMASIMLMEKTDIEKNTINPEMPFEERMEWGQWMIREFDIQQKASIARESRAAAYALVLAEMYEQAGNYHLAALKGAKVLYETRRTAEARRHYEEMLAEHELELPALRELVAKRLVERRRRQEEERREAAEAEADMKESYRQVLENKDSRLPEFRRRVAERQAAETEPPAQEPPAKEPDKNDKEGKGWSFFKRKKK